MTVLHKPSSRWRSRPRLVSLTNALQVHRVLSAAPCVLPSHPDERARLVTRKLQTGEPSRLAGIVRDLTWHQRKGLANPRDVRLLQCATSELSAWLAAQKGIARARAKKRIRGTVERAVSSFIGRSHSWAASRNGTRKRGSCRLRGEMVRALALRQPRPPKCSGQMPIGHKI